MMGRSICLEDGKGNFNAFTLVPNAKYENRVFTIKFNKELRPHIFELKQNFTTLQLSVVTTLKDWSIRIYEVLKKDLYLSDRNPDKKCKIEYRLSEFRFMIGLANIDDKKVRSAVNKHNPDWDQLYELLPKKDKLYERPRDLEKNVLEPAKLELKAKSELLFDYELIKEGRSYKRIVFTIQRQKIVETEELKKKQNIIKRGFVQMEIPLDMPQYRDFLDKYEGDEGFHFGREDLTLLLETAAYDEKLVERAIEAARQEHDLDNFMGWIIKYIERGGYEDRPSFKGNVDIPIKVKAAQEALKAERIAGSLHQNMWESYRTRERFPEFIEFLAEHSCDEEAFIDIYGYERACKIYFDWNRGVDVDFTIG